VCGGAEGVASGEDAAVTGGAKNTAETTDSLAPNPEGLTVLSKAEQEGLKPVLKYLRYDGSGVGGKPTVRIEGPTCRSCRGGIPQRGNAGDTGNLVVGQDEEAFHGEWEGDLVEAGKQTGSGNLLIGDEQHFSSYNSLVGGFENTDSAPTATCWASKTQPPAKTRRSAVATRARPRASSPRSAAAPTTSPTTSRPR
jgi:hypothetical protein